MSFWHFTSAVEMQAIPPPQKKGGERKRKLIIAFAVLLIIKTQGQMLLIFCHFSPVKNACYVWQEIHSNLRSISKIAAPWWCLM